MRYWLTIVLSQLTQVALADQTFTPPLPEITFSHSPPLGGITIAAQPYRETPLGIPFHRAAVAMAHLTDVDAPVFNLSENSSSIRLSLDNLIGEPETYSLDADSGLPVYFLEIMTGAATGQRFPIINNGTNWVVIEGVPQGTLAASHDITAIRDQVRIRPCWTPNTMLPASSALLDAQAESATLVESRDADALILHDQRFIQRFGGAIDLSNLVPYSNGYEFDYMVSPSTVLSLEIKADAGPDRSVYFGVDNNTDMMDGSSVTAVIPVDDPQQFSIFNYPPIISSVEDFYRVGSGWKSYQVQLNFSGPITHLIIYSSDCEIRNIRFHDSAYEPESDFYWAEWTGLNERSLADNYGILPGQVSRVRRTADTDNATLTLTGDATTFAPVWQVPMPNPGEVIEWPFALTESTTLTLNASGLKDILVASTSANDRKDELIVWANETGFYPRPAKRFYLQATGGDPIWREIGNPTTDQGDFQLEPGKAYTIRRRGE